MNSRKMCVYGETTKYEIIQFKNGETYIKNKYCNKYYFKTSFNLQKWKENIALKIKYWEVIDYIYLFLIAFSFPCLIILVSCLFGNYKLYAIWELIPSFAILFFNILFHELSHWLTLYSFGRKPGKYKLKFTFIFPTICLNTNEAYMLPKFERICVFYAGIMMNIYICISIILINSDYIRFLYPSICMLCFNLIPIGGVETDGYHIFITTLLNIKKTKTRKSFVEYILKIIYYVFSIYLSIKMIVMILSLL